MRQVQLNRRYAALYVGEQVRIRWLLRVDLHLMRVVEAEDIEAEREARQEEVALILVVVCNTWKVRESGCPRGYIVSYLDVCHNS